MDYKKPSSTGIEIPLVSKRPAYRFFEMVPGLISWSLLLLAFVLSAWNAMVGAVYVLVVVVIMFIRGLITIRSAWLGYRMMAQAELVDWRQRLNDLDIGRAFHSDKSEFQLQQHLDNIADYNNPDLAYPRVNQVYNLVIIAAYNETIDVLGPTIDSLLNTTFDKQRMIVCLAYEARGGEAMEATAKKVLKKYKNSFFKMEIVKHPSNLPKEVIGKGGNITFAARAMSKMVRQLKLDPKNIIVTTLDSDNRPHRGFFDYVAYEFITHPNRQKSSFQPVSLYLNNIWDVPAPVRIVAASNSFWNTVCTSRLHKLRNFASHAQPLAALEAMNYWSRRTIVEDGHQFWRSYFYFNGEYSVVPIRVPIYQDAVLSSTYRKTLKDQFIQIRRWAYGASDVPYVAMMIRRRWRDLPLGDAIWKFGDLLEGHVSWAVAALLVLVGGWLPLIFNHSASRSLVAHRLPLTVGAIQQVAMVGIIAMIVFFIKLLPPRPRRYKTKHSAIMLVQWIIAPISLLIYGSLAAFYSQTRLLTGRYLDRFDVTDKNTVRKD